MKPFRYLRVLALILCACCATVACGDIFDEPWDPGTPSGPSNPPSNPPATNYTLTVKPNGTVTFPKDGGTVNFSISTNADRFGATFPKRDWLSLAISKDKKGIDATIAANDTGSERSFEIKFYGMLNGGDDAVVEEVVKCVQPAQTTSGGDTGEPVSSNGGTVTCEDFSITFPKGAFTSTKNVAVEKAGDGLYKVTMPISTHQPITLSIQCDEYYEDARFIMKSKYLARSTGEMTEEDFFLNTDYSNGLYTTTLKAFDNDSDTERDSFIISLAHVTDTKTGYTPSYPKGRELLSGTTQAIKWKLFVREGVDEVAFYNILMPISVQKIGSFIEDALNIIVDQGYDLEDPDRVIHYYIDNIHMDAFGYFDQNMWSDTYNFIGLTANKFSTAWDTDFVAIKSTILHETFHYFQSDYDPRSPKYKANWFDIVGNENILYEMGAVWMEQFVRNGKLDPVFLNGDVFYYNDFFGKGDIPGLGMEEERWITLAGKSNKHDAYMYQGYFMAPMLYYFTTELNSFGFNRSAVRELHLLWNAKWRSGYTAYNILEEWVKIMHNCYFFEGAAFIDDYYLDLLRDRVVEDVNAHTFYEGLKTNLPKFNDKPETKKKYEFDQKVYPFGCAVRKIALEGFKGIPMAGKDIIVKQESNGVHTYMVVTDVSSKYKNYRTVTRNGEIFAATKGDSLVISGKTLESLKFQSGTYVDALHHELYLITTNLENKLYSTTVNPNRVSIELRDNDFNPTKISLLCEFQNSNGQQGRISMWGERGNSSGAQFSVTRSGSDYKVTMTRREDEDNVNEECTFTLKKNGEKNFVVKDLKYKFSSSWYWDETTTAYNNASLSIDNMPQVNYLSSTAWWEADDNSVISYTKDSNAVASMSYSKGKGQSIGSNTFRVQLNF